MSRPTVLPDWATDAIYSSGPQSGSTNKVSPFVLGTQGFTPSALVAAEAQNYMFSNVAGWIDYQDLLQTIFGLGDDGPLSLVGTTKTLTSDAHYSSISVDGTSIIKTNGFRIYCSGTCTIASGGSIICNGSSGVNNTPGSDTNGTMYVGGAGGAGTNGTGTAGTATTETFGSAGGAGGAGSAGGGGAAGSVAVPAATYSSFLDLPGLMTQQIVGQTGGTPHIKGMQGGSGGGGGGGNGGSVLGGGGGAGGGIVLLVAYTIANAGSITAKGGNGGNGSGGAGEGGGGGGGGGTIVLVTRNYSGAGTTVVTGGTGGAGSLANGSNGSAGNVYTRSI